MFIEVTHQQTNRTLSCSLRSFANLLVWLWGPISKVQQVTFNCFQLKAEDPAPAWVGKSKQCLSFGVKAKTKAWHKPKSDPQRYVLAQQNYPFPLSKCSADASKQTLKPKSRCFNALSFALSMLYVSRELQPSIYIAGAGLLRAGALLFDLILPLNVVTRWVLASCAGGRFPQPCLCLPCNPQTRKKQANSSLSRSSSASGRKGSPPQTARKPNWSRATPSGTSATVPSPPMKSPTVVWGRSAPDSWGPVQTQGSLPLLLRGRAWW